MGESLEPRRWSLQRDEIRSHHCPPAWVTERGAVFKKKKKNSELGVTEELFLGEKRALDKGTQTTPLLPGATAEEGTTEAAKHKPSLTSWKH